MLVSRGFGPDPGLRPTRLRAALIAVALLVLNATSGLHDPSCAHHGGMVHTVATSETTAGPHPATLAEVVAEGVSHDADGDSSDGCTCIGGTCHPGGTQIGFAPASALPAATAAILTGIRVAPRQDPLPPPPDHLFPYSTAPPASLSH